MRHISIPFSLMIMFAFKLCFSLKPRFIKRCCMGAWAHGHSGQEPGLHSLSRFLKAPTSPCYKCGRGVGSFARLESAKPSNYLSVLVVYAVAVQLLTSGLGIRESEHCKSQTTRWRCA